VIKDLEYIRSLQVAFNQLPTEGEMMKDLAESARHLVLEFKCGEIKDVVEFFDSQVKTPATSFYSRSKKLEEPLWIEIQSLFSAEKKLGTQTPYYEGLILSFGDFELAYLGGEDRTPPGTTASSYAQKFMLSSKKFNLEKLLTVSSGQLPPRPVDFEVNKKFYVLHTFSFGKEKIRPRHLVITEK
jgi:hypothetical protein